MREAHDWRDDEEAGAQWTPNSNVLMLDMDLLRMGRTFDLGTHRETALQQLARDVQLMTRIGVFDYSLVIGVEDVDEDQMTGSLGEFTLECFR